MLHKTVLEIIVVLVINNRYGEIKSINITSKEKKDQNLQRHFAKCLQNKLVILKRYLRRITEKR